MEEKESELSVDKEIEQLIRESMPEGLVTNFIIIAEVASSSQQELSLSISDSMTPWLAHGMLELAIEMMRSGEYQFPYMEENNEQ
jgi:hypothetical protein